MDYIFGHFVDSEVAGLSDEELDAFEILMEYPDRDLFAWLSGEVVPPDEVQTDIYDKVYAFHHANKAE